MSTPNSTSKLNHRNARQSNTHSLYQTNLLADHTQLLTDIKSNTANINLNVDSLEVNTDGLESLVTTTNSKLPSALTGSGNLKVCIQELGNEGSERLNVDCGSTLTQLPSALTGEGNLKVSIQEDHTHDLATSSNQTTNHSKLDVLEASLTSMESKQDTQVTHLSEIEGAVETLEACVGSNKVNVNISSGSMSLATGASTSALQTDGNNLLTGIDGVLDNILLKNTDAETHLGNIDTGVDVLEACVGSNKVNVNISSGNITGFATSTLQGTTNGKLDTLEASLTSMEGKIDVVDSVLDNILSKNTDAETHLGNIDTGVDVLEACVGSNKVNVNISSGSMSLASGASTSALQTDGNNLLTGIDGVLDNILLKNTDAETHLGNIDTGVDVLEACVGSNKVNVNISSGNISGFATSTLQGTTNGKLDTLEASLTSMESKQDTQVTHLSEIEGAVETLEGCVSGSELQVDIVGGNITGFATSTLQGTTNGKLDTLESSLTSIEGKIDTLDSVLDNIKVDTEAIETAVEALNTRDSLTTTLIIDGQSVASSGTHTSGSVEITNIPPGGKLHFLIRISGVSPTDISTKVLLSADDTNFFGADPLQHLAVGQPVSGVGQFVTCSFIAKHLKIELSNSNGSSNATCTCHMFN